MNKHFLPHYYMYPYPIYTHFYDNNSNYPTDVNVQYNSSLNDSIIILISFIK